MSFTKGIVATLIPLFIGALFGATTISHGQARPEFREGAWLETLTSLEDPRWLLEDLVCRGCSVEALEYTRAVLADPASDDRSLESLRIEFFEYNRDHLAGVMSATGRAQAAGYDQLDDPVNECIPSGFFFASGPLPIWIEQHDDLVLLRYEFWHSARTVYTDGRDHPTDLEPSRLGHSIGWYDGPHTLVVETTGFEPHIFGAISGVDGLRTSERARAIERYTLSDDGERMDIQVTVVDPVILKRPYTYLDSRLWDPNVEYLDEPQCEALSGVQ